MDILNAVFKIVFILCPPFILFEFIGEFIYLFFTVKTPKWVMILFMLSFTPILMLCFVISYNYPITSFIVAWVFYFNRKQVLSPLAKLFHRPLPRIR